MTTEPDSRSAAPADKSTQPVSAVRARVLRVVEADWFVWFISAVIGVNAVTLGLETSDWAMARFGGMIVTLDVLALTIFCLEIGMKLFAYGPRFFKSGWNVFDFVIVAIALAPDNESVAVLRALRALRALRLISVVPQMRAVVGALLSAIPGMGAIVAVLVLVFYVAGVMATKMFSHPDHPELDLLFGSVGASMYTLFQVMTLEGWSMEVVRPVMEVYPWAWAFFIPFIIVTSFAVLNLFLALIVNCMHMIEDEQSLADRKAAEAAAQDDRQNVQAELQSLRDEIQGLRADLRATLEKRS